MIKSKRYLLLKELSFKFFVHCLLISSSGQSEQAVFYKSAPKRIKFREKKILTDLKSLSLVFKVCDLFRIEMISLKILILAA